MKVGDKIKDNDPRMKHRGLLEIYEIGPMTQRGKDYVFVRDMKLRCFRLVADRVHVDGKDRQSGFSLVEGFAEAQRPDEKNF